MTHTITASVGKGTSPAPKPAPFTGVFSHPDADKVVLKYGIQGDGKPVRKMNSKAEHLLKMYSGQRRDTRCKADQYLEDLP